jgi:hypothetical protein
VTAGPRLTSLPSRYPTKFPHISVNSSTPLNPNNENQSTIVHGGEPHRGPDVTHPTQRPTHSAQRSTPFLRNDLFISTFVTLRALKSILENETTVSTCSSTCCYKILHLLRLFGHQTIDTSFNNNPGSRPTQFMVELDWGLRGNAYSSRLLLRRHWGPSRRHRGPLSWGSGKRSTQPTQVG